MAALLSDHEAEIGCVKVETGNRWVASAIEDHERYIAMLKEEFTEKVTLLDGELKAKEKIHQLVAERNGILLDKAQTMQKALQSEVDDLYGEISSRNEAAMNVVTSLFGEFSKLSPLAFLHF